MGNEKVQEIELEQDYAVIENFPEDAIELTVEAAVFLDGHIQNVRALFNMWEIAEALQETKDGYMPGIRDIPYEEIDDYEPPDNCIVIYLPTLAVSVTIKAKVYRDDELTTIEQKLGPPEIRKAFKRAEEDYIPSDALFTLTDEAREKIEAAGGDINRAIEEFGL